MRIRTIKPEFWASESVGRLSRDARLLFIGLWNFADDYGRGRGAFAVIASSLFPYDDDARESVESWFMQLHKEGMVRRYLGHDGNWYYDIPKWNEHQSISHPRKSAFPPFAEVYQDLPQISEDCGKFPKIAENCGNLPSGGYQEFPSGTREQGNKGKEQGNKGTRADAQPTPKIEQSKPVELPEQLDNDKFKLSWIDWLAYRKQIKKALSASTQVRQLAHLASFGTEAATWAIDQSIRNGWQGLFPDKFTPGVATSTNGPPLRNGELYRNVDVSTLSCPDGEF